MNKMSIKLATGLATGALLASVIAPSAFAATTVTVSGNGTNSNNTVNVKNKQKTSVQQANTSTVKNKAKVTQKTGGNKANGNTGGSVTLTSGSVSSSVNNTTMTGGNVANVDPCGCPLGDTDIDISGNGSHSDNDVTVKNIHATSIQQSNSSTVVNKTTVKQVTGNNTANNNTGGDVELTSGDADSQVDNHTETGGNTLNP